MTLLNGRVQSPIQTTRGFDADTRLSAATARLFKQDGYDFCVRYVSLGDERPSDLSYQEACDILDAGLALMPVQHVAEPHWMPDAVLGQAHGAAAASNARGVGFPGGVNRWCDLEGCNPAASPANVIAYCTAWYAAVDADGFKPGLYVGAGSVLTGQVLYSNLPFKHYWKSESNVPDVAVRGYQMVQTPADHSVNQISIDYDQTQADHLGDQVLWLAPHS